MHTHVVPTRQSLPSPSNTIASGQSIAQAFTRSMDLCTHKLILSRFSALNSGFANLTPKGTIRATVRVQARRLGVECVWHMIETTLVLSRKWK